MSALEMEHIWIQGIQTKVHLIAKGYKDGIPVIFLPGITSYSLSFARILERMPDGCYALSMDVRGRGLSDRPKEGYWLKDYAEDLLNVVNGLAANPIPPVLVGHSMGARIAVAFDSMYPGLISGMVLIDPPVNGPGQREVYPNALSMFVEQKEAVEQGRLDKFRELLPSFTEAQLLERAEEYRNTGWEALLDSYRSFLREPFQMYLKRSSAPALLLAAEWGDTIRDEELRVLRRLRPDMETHRVPGVGHMIYKEAPQLTADRIISFVDRIISDK